MKWNYIACNCHKLTLKSTFVYSSQQKTLLTHKISFRITAISRFQDRYWTCLDSPHGFCQSGHHEISERVSRNWFAVTLMHLYLSPNFGSIIHVINETLTRSPSICTLGNFPFCSHMAYGQRSMLCSYILLYNYGWFFTLLSLNN